MRMDSADYNRLVLSVSRMRSTLELEPWISRGQLAELYGRELGDAISDLRRCIDPLADQQIPEATTGLAFIKDALLQESIRSDIAFANQAFRGLVESGNSVGGGCGRSSVALGYH